MELTYSTAEKATRRTYKHFTITSHTAPAPDTAGTRRLEFFYIGKKAANIDRLITAFESGYAAETVSNAINMLKRLASSRNSMPDLIIMEAAGGPESLRELHQFMISHKALAAVPLVAEVSGMQPEALHGLKNLRFIDDMMVLGDHNRSTLTRKISFLKRIKHAVVHETAGFGIETSFKEPSLFTAVAKRSFDVVVSSSLLLALSPVMILVMAAIRLESRGSLFYIAKRAGRGYRIFNFYKFRTMFVGADQKVKEMSHLNQYNTNNTGPVFFKVDNDPRITRVGNFLRKTSLDELPQLLNVLLGDMSLVGNRPLPLYEAASLTTDEWAKRFMAPAGITGLWQVKKRGKKEMSVEERLNLDIDYADRYSFMYDLWIMANTPSALIQSTKA
ncbi:MAG: sugar transferase [Candidatus Pseudobacter hemicellulosilyticus]|uniref:Sugar transferase n=1 Tax=Candidatus Pseudobacter hemicellulosilyticus TaxID=3121375 RepID=A0AAJ5WVA0_9BACT|nr:MAG: sugar transferase [Pseudobacter sp.]